MEFDSYVLQYIASCTPLPDRVGIDDCNALKKRMRKEIMPDQSKELFYADIQKPFPDIATNIRTGVFGRTKPQEYFEGRGDKFHSMELYKFSQDLMATYDKASKAQPLSQEAIDAVMYTIWYANICSTKLAKGDGTVYAFGVEYKDKLDFKYFENISFDANPDDFYFVHGRSGEGNVVIRKVDENDVKSYMQWHEKMKEEKGANPFIRFKDNLESILSQSYQK